MSVGLIELVVLALVVALGVVVLAVVVGRSRSAQDRVPRTGPQPSASRDALSQNGPGFDGRNMAGGGA